MADIRQALRLANLMYQCGSMQYTWRERDAIRARYKELKEAYKHEHQRDQNR